MRLGHVDNAKSAFAHVGDDFMKKQVVSDEAEIIGLISLSIAPYLIHKSPFKAEFLRD